MINGKRTILSLLLSFLIVTMGVGMPYVQPRCGDCTGGSNVTTLAYINIEKHLHHSCEKKYENVSKKDCCSNHSQRSEKQTCSKIIVEKVDLPTLISHINVDSISTLWVNLLYDATNSSFHNANLNSIGAVFHVPDDADRPNRHYLSMICTFII